jgi:molybdopterin-guanine dinucleotide biosynthesis protein A
VVEAPAPVACVAWDMPFVTPALLRRLADGLATADACLPEGANRRGVEPLCAAYGPDVAGPMAAALDRGDYRAVAFHAAVRVGILPLAVVASFGDPAELFFNVNTPEDLERAREIDRRRPG